MEHLEEPTFETAKYESTETRFHIIRRLPKFTVIAKFKFVSNYVFPFSLRHPNTIFRRPSYYNKTGVIIRQRNSV